MTIIFGTLLLAALLGFLAGGRLSNLAQLRIRWLPAAMLGLALQLAPVSGGDRPLLLLYVSFILLASFAVANLRDGIPGAALILVGILMNFTVIAVNEGMPVTRDALVRSGQMSTLEFLVEEGGAKHHLAGPQDDLLFLGDVIPIGPPIRQAISLGDVFTYGGVVWLIVVGMLRRPVTSSAGSRPIEMELLAVPREGSGVG